MPRRVLLTSFIFAFTRAARLKPQGVHAGAEVPTRNESTKSSDGNRSSVVTIQSLAGPTGLIRLKGDSSKCVNVIGGYQGNGGGLQMYQCIDGHADETFVMPSGGTGPIVWKKTGKCLNVEGGKDSMGARIQIWDCYASPDFQFIMPQGGIGPIKWGKNPSKCLNVAGDGKLQLHGCYPDHEFQVPQGQGASDGGSHPAPPPMAQPWTPPKTDFSGPLDAASPRGSSMVFTHLFEWSWDDIAKECEVFLGPKGFTAVQVSPPNEHIAGDAWWTRYQPVSYKLISRSGDEAAFASMVKRCAKVGVGIYVDAVINHMAAGSGRSNIGTGYGNRAFPNIYSQDDFHHLQNDKGRNCEVTNYNDKWNVQYCDLVGLADLCTSCPYVQNKIAEYINSLKKYGVAGFRIDAAKHIDAGELGGILGKTDSSMYRFLEVIGHGNEPVKPSQYYHLGAITEFNYAIKVAENMNNPNGLQHLGTFGESWGLMPTKNAVVFIDNHDTQRGHAGEAALTYKSGGIYDLANIFMLAHPYGYPSIMSSYNFGGSDQGPPKGNGVHQHWGVNCGYDKAWQCEHRRTHIANMVAWRKSAGDAWTNGWANVGSDKVSFCRGSTACIAINRNGHQAWQASFKVSMPPGEYCNIMRSDTPDCERVRVGGDQMVHVKVDPMFAVAFHVGKRL